MSVLSSDKARRPQRAVGGDLGRGCWDRRPRPADPVIKTTSVALTAAETKALNALSKGTGLSRNALIRGAVQRLLAETGTEQWQAKLNPQTCSPIQDDPT